VNSILRPSNWSWAPGLILATGTIISSGAGSLLIQYAIEGTKDGPLRIPLLAVATLAGGALVWWAARLNSRRSARAGWFLYCTAATAGYQRQRFESEDTAYRQWALRLSPAPHILPRLQVDAGQPGGTLRYLDAVERDLEVAFGMSPDVRQQVYLLANGLHEANFWLGWHLASTFRRSRPLKAMSVRCVADQPAAPGTDSHAVIGELPQPAAADGPHRVIGLDITRHRGPGQPQPAGNGGVQITPACRAGGTWATCHCEQPHRSAIIAIDPEVHLGDAAAPDPASAVAVTSPRMEKGITAIAPEIGADLVLWIVCDGIGPSAGAYDGFLQTVIHAIHQHTAGLGRRYLAFTGPVVLATLLGVHLAKQGQWSFLAYNGRSYTEVPNPRADRPAAPAPLKITLKNYTPHRLTYLHGGHAIDLPSLGTARCQERVENSGHWDASGEIPRVRVGYGKVSGLPEPEKGVIYVVSQLVVQALPDRSDLAYPHELHRDSAGTITGFSALAVPEQR